MVCTYNKQHLYLVNLLNSLLILHVTYAKATIVSSHISSCADTDKCASCGGYFSAPLNKSEIVQSFTGIIEQESDVKLYFWAYDEQNQSHLILNDYYHINAYDSDNNFLSDSNSSTSDPFISNYSTTVPLGLLSDGVYEFDIIIRSDFDEIHSIAENWNFTAYLWCIPKTQIECGDTKTIHFSYWNIGYQSVTNIIFDTTENKEVTDIELQLTGDIYQYGIRELDVEMTYDIDNEHQRRANKNGTLMIHDLNEDDHSQYLVQVSKFIWPEDTSPDKWDSTINLTLTCHCNPKTNEDLLRYQQDIEEIFTLSLFILSAVFIFIGISGLVDARCVRINDFYRIGAIFAATIQILDMLSDSFLAIDIYLQDKIDPGMGYNIMLYICIICIVLPSLLSLFQVYYFSQRIWNKNDKAREWLIKYSKFLYIFSVFTGSSFTAIEIMNSNIFGLSWFEMGLSNKQVVAFKTQRIYSVILLEVTCILCSVCHHSQMTQYITCLIC